MQNINLLSSLTLGTIILSACGGRVANTVAVDTALDSKLSCAHLKGEASNHEKRLIELLGEQDDKGMHNLGMLLVSPLFLDLSGSEKEEVEAIGKRQERLTELMSSKGCKA